jgi:hypothetical protein
MNNLEKTTKTNPEGTVAFGRPAIRRTSPELRKRIEKYVSETRNPDDSMTAKN